MEDLSMEGVRQVLKQVELISELPNSLPRQKFLYYSRQLINQWTRLREVETTSLRSSEEEFRQVVLQTRRLLSRLGCESLLLQRERTESDVPERINS